MSRGVVDDPTESSATPSRAWVLLPQQDVAVVTAHVADTLAAIRFTPASSPPDSFLTATGLGRSSFVPSPSWPV
jgi:hypothetical protein